MSRLSQREKVLLIMLAFVLLIGLGMLYGIMPLKTQINALEEEKAALETQEIQMKTTIAQTGRLIENKENLIKDVDDLMRGLSDPLTEENFDRTTQSLARDRHLDIQSVQYSNVEVVSPSAIETPLDTYEYNLKALVHTYLGFDGEVINQVETENEVLKQTVTVEVEGTYLSIQRFLGDLSNVGRTYYVRDITYERQENVRQLEGEGIILDVEVAETATITVDVYFLEKQVSTGYLPQK